MIQGHKRISKKKWKEKVDDPAVCIMDTEYDI